MSPEARKKAEYASRQECPSPLLDRITNADAWPTIGPSLTELAPRQGFRQEPHTVAKIHVVKGDSVKLLGKNELKFLCIVDKGCGVNNPNCSSITKSVFPNTS